MQGITLVVRSLALLLSVCFLLRNTLLCPTDVQLILLDCYVQIVNYYFDLTSYLKGTKSASSPENSDTKVKRFWYKIGVSCRSINSSRTNCVQLFIQSAHYFCPVLKEVEFLFIHLVRNHSIKYHKTPFSGVSGVPSERTDMSKLIVTFRS